MGWGGVTPSCPQGQTVQGHRVMISPPLEGCWGVVAGARRWDLPSVKTGYLRPPEGKPALLAVTKTARQKRHDLPGLPTARVCQPSVALGARSLDPPHWWESVPPRACALGALSPAHPGPARGRARTPAPPPASACAPPRARLRERLPGACGRAGALAAGAQCERRSFSFLADARI